jgi:plastocyanin
MNPKTLFMPVLIAMAFALSACGGGDDGGTSTGSAAGPAPDSGGRVNAPAPSGGVPRAEKVEIADFAYDPDPVTVQVGGKVIWLNQDSTPHTATAVDGNFDTGTLAQGKLGSETFKQAGTYEYMCQIHPAMHGTVEVVEKD